MTGLVCKVCGCERGDPLGNHMLMLEEVDPYTGVVRRRGLVGSPVVEAGYYPHEFVPAERSL